MRVWTGVIACERSPRGVCLQLYLLSTVPGLQRNPTFIKGAIGPACRVRFLMLEAGGRTSRSDQSHFHLLPQTRRDCITQPRQLGRLI